MATAEHAKKGQGEGSFRGSFMLSLLGIVVLFGIHLGERYYLLSSETAFWVVTVSLLGYIGVETIGVAASKEPRWLLVPPVLISGATFVLNFAGTNLIYYLRSPANNGMLSYGIRGYTWMTLSMKLAFVAVLALWVGYKLQLGQRIGDWFHERLVGTDWLRRTFSPNWPLLTSLYFSALLVRLFAFSVGLLTYYSAGEQQIQWAAFTWYIKAFDAFGSVFLIIVALWAFSKRTKTAYWLMLAVLVVEMVFGIMTGFKKAIVFPFVYVGICSYVVRGRIPWRMVAGSILVIGFAYMVIEPLRTLSNESTGSGVNGVSGVMSSTTDVLTGEVGSGEAMGAETTLVEFLKRTNKTVRCAVALRSFESGQIASARPRFRERMYMWPLYAVVPRLIWPSKPKQRLGRWFNDVVLNRDRVVNAVSLSPIGFLYIAGGVWMIVVTFLFLGVLGRVLRDSLMYAGTGGLLTYLGLVGLMAKIPDPVYGVPIQMIRFLPVLLVVQYIVYRR